MNANDMLERSMRDLTKFRSITRRGVVWPGDVEMELPEAVEGLETPDSVKKMIADTEQRGVLHYSKELMRKLEESEPPQIIEDENSSE